jgi:hypothetical protein
MKSALLGVVAAAAIAAFSPAQGQSVAASSFTASSAFRDMRPPTGPGLTGVPARQGRMRHIRVGRDVVAFPYPGGYYDYGDYDANRSFDPDRWNDWWHDRPERAFPRWVWSNQNCTPDRMWYSGSGWRCTP